MSGSVAQMFTRGWIGSCLSVYVLCVVCAKRARERERERGIFRHFSYHQFHTMRIQVPKSVSSGSDCGSVGVKRSNSNSGSRSEPPLRQYCAVGLRLPVPKLCM